MFFKKFIFCISLIALLKPSVQLSYDDDDVYADYDNDYDLDDEDDDVKIVITEYRNIEVDTGSDVFLKCLLPKNGNATWNDTQPNHEVRIINETKHYVSREYSELSIKNINKNYTNTCQTAELLMQQFSVVVRDPPAPIVNQSTHFVKWGTNLTITCVARSYLPVDTAYLHVENTVENQTITSNWQSRKRICPNNDYDSPDCVLETTFQFNKEVFVNEGYRCGYEKAESENTSVEIMVTDRKIYDYTSECYSAAMQDKIAEFAIEALQKYGATKDAATYIREKCNQEFRGNHWNCIISNQLPELSLSPDMLTFPYSSIKFSLGSVSFYVFETRKPSQ